MTIIKTRREELKMTQRELADKVGVTDAFISMLEEGKRRPSIDIVYRLADALELDCNTVMRQWQRW